MENNCLLEVINLKKYFEVKKGFFSKPLYIKAVDGVSFSLKRGETIALVGESGSGKTTLGKTILGIYSPTSGKIIFKGRDLSNLKPNELPLYRRKVQLIQQDPFGSIPYFFPIYRVLEEPLIVNKIGNREERRKLIYDALMSVRLLPVEDFYSKYPHMLSGGQLQRVAIARALVIEPELIVADEPVSMLDASVKVEVLALLRELQEKRKISFIYITHDLSTIKYFSEKIFIMYAGQIVEKADREGLFKNPLHPYTQALLKAIPDIDPNNRKKFREVASGEPPSLINPPSGCRFNPRCPYVTDKCRVEEPPEIEVLLNHSVKCWLYK
ncbi:MAG: ABC transporter ATP-binding protein [Candidatus Bathyarchaeia archaeon]